jgi:dipeptidyl aminopeptidase/acylaminoacyl peptidase
MNHTLRLGGAIFFTAAVLLFSSMHTGLMAQQQDTLRTIDRWLVSEAVQLFMPAFSDQKNVKGKPFKVSDLLKHYPLSPEKETMKGNIFSEWDTVSSNEDGEVDYKIDKNYDYARVSQVSFIRANSWTKVKLVVESRQGFEVYLGNELKVKNYSLKDGEDNPAVKKKELTLEPGRHQLLIRSLFSKEEGASWRVKVKLLSAEDQPLTDVDLNVSSTEYMDIDHLLHGKQLQMVKLNPKGTMMMLSYNETLPPDGHSESWAEIMDLETSQVIYSTRNTAFKKLKWAIDEDEISYSVKSGEKHKLIVFNLKTHQKEVVYEADESVSDYKWANDGSFFIFWLEEKPGKDKSGVKKLEGMPDRWPWWQHRYQLYRLNVEDGSVSRLTWGHVSHILQDIHPEGTHILFTQNVPNYSERPYSKQYLMEMDLSDLSVDTVWEKNQSASVSYSPDGRLLLVRGGPMMFGDKGKNVPEGQIPNDYDTQLYIYDRKSGDVDPISREFNPAVDDAVWHRPDNNIYILGEDSTYKRLFVYNVKEASFNNIEAKVDVVKNISLSSKAMKMGYCGSSISYPALACVYDVSSGKDSLVIDPESDFFRNIEFGKTEEWIFTSGAGNPIDGRIYYPPGFDPQKKYPLIVYYYGGTSPTERNFRGRYPKNLFAAMGYLVYVLQPSGATGYGQEFSARHVNNWGITVADEIIEGTRKFLNDHDFVDPEAVGCIGASYGGFMTMLLTTKTDIFSAAIAHAGISSISSYWGQGYWGYLYSSAATANSFPWNNKELYVEQSPLFHADKVNTPLLLLTGGADTNVPPGESVQFYTALKLLGKEVELVEIEGENHHILDFKKRILWQKTIFAWFDKWLKGEEGWWKNLYPDKDL